MNMCEICNNTFLDFAGPIWLGKLHDKIFVNQLISNLNYENKDDSNINNNENNLNINKPKSNINFK